MTQTENASYDDYYMAYTIEWAKNGEPRRTTRESEAAVRRFVDSLRQQRGVRAITVTCHVRP